jgi:hypothetical protein
MLIENLNERIQPSLTLQTIHCGLVLPWSAIRKENGRPGSYRRAWSNEVQQSDMYDDGSSEGDFILAPPVAAFKVFGAE